MKHKCPICKSATDSATDAEFPFCSAKCRERDLGNWATEKYVVSEPLFTEDVNEELQQILDDADSDGGASGSDRRTIILNLDDSNDAEHGK